MASVSDCPNTVGSALTTDGHDQAELRARHVVRRPLQVGVLHQVLARWHSPDQRVYASPAALLTCTEMAWRAAADTTAKLWDYQSGKDLVTFKGHSQGISDVAWSPTNSYICTASDDQTIQVWDVETVRQAIACPHDVGGSACFPQGTSLRTLKGHTSYVFCANWNPQSNLIVSGSFDESVRIWDPKARLCSCLFHSNALTARAGRCAAWQVRQDTSSTL